MPLSNCCSDIIQAIKALLHRDNVFFILIFLCIGRGRADGRRITLSSLALDNNVSTAGPQYQRKKPKFNVRIN